MINLSIIILSYNTKKITKKCVETVCASLDTNPNISAEIIVLDNASTDGSRDMLKRIKDKRLVTILNKKNLGFTGGNNKAVTKAKGSVVLLLNSDIEVINDAIPQLYQQFTNGPYNIAGGKLLNKNMSPQPSCARFYTLPIAFAALFLKADSWGFSRSSPNQQTQCDWIMGACMIMKKKTYEKLNGFDESIFMYWDEVDLCYRANKQGYSVGYYPKPRFIHLEGASADTPGKPIEKIYKGYVYFYKKHYSSTQLQILRYMLQLKSLIAIIVGQLTGNKALVKAHKNAYEIAQKT